MADLPSHQFIACFNPAQPIKLTEFNTFGWEAAPHTLAEVNHVNTAGNLAAYLTFVENDKIDRATLELEGLGRGVIESETATFYFKALTPAVKSFLKAFFTNLGYENPSEVLKILHDNDGGMVLLNAKG